ncbi:MAG: hypothetical protein ABIL68_14045 [bacterium]
MGFFRNIKGCGLSGKKIWIFTDQCGKIGRCDDTRIPLFNKVLVLFRRKELPHSGIKLLYGLILKTKEPAFLNALFHG